MSFEIPGEVNPFEAPRARIGEEIRELDLADNDAETIRREHLGREANIKSVGHLNYFGAFIFGLFTLLMLVMVAGVLPMPPNQQNSANPAMEKIVLGFGAVFYLTLGSLNGALGYGLTHLQVWARWTAVVFTSLGLLGIVFYGLIIAFMVNPAGGTGFGIVFGGFNGLILWLLLSKKAGMVFSDEYKQIILKTPHVRLKTSMLAWIVLGLILISVHGLVGAGFISGLKK